MRPLGNLNPHAATCGRVTIVEVEERVGVGELDPDQIHTPGVFVQRILEGRHFEKRIERLVERAADRSLVKRASTLPQTGVGVVHRLISS